MAAVFACAQFIRDVVERRGLKHLHIAHKLGYKRNGAVSAVIHGERPLPLDDLEKWVEALELSGDDAVVFRRLALRSYAPPYVQMLMDGMDALKAKLEAIERDDDQADDPPSR